MKWTIVVFDHPNESRSRLYRRGLTEEGLIEAVREAMNSGANLMSIRGFVVGDVEREVTGP